MLTEDQIERIHAALTPDHHSKSAYVGRISQNISVIVHAEDGTPIQKELSIFISWDSIELIMNMIRKRAGL